jgi:hypothetical protein
VNILDFRVPQGIYVNRLVTVHVAQALSRKERAEIRQDESFSYLDFPAKRFNNLDACEPASFAMFCVKSNESDAYSMKGRFLWAVRELLYI